MQAPGPDVQAVLPPEHAFGRESFEFWLLSRGRTQNTVHGYVKVYDLWEQWCRSNDLQPLQASTADVARWLVQSRDREPATIRNYLVATRAFYRHLRNFGVRADDPTAGLAGPRVILKPIQPYSREELAALLAAMHAPRERAIILVLLGGGLRAGELVKMRIEDINWADNTVRIRGKGNKTRLVAPGKAAMEALGAYVHTREEQWRPLVPRLRHVREAERARSFWGFRTTSGLRAWFRRRARRAGVPTAHLHKCRHTFASAFLEAGGTEGQLQKVLGHSQITMSLHYAETVRERIALEQQRRLDVGGQMLAACAVLDK